MDGKPRLTTTLDIHDDAKRTRTDADGTHSAQTRDRFTGSAAYTTGVPAMIGAMLVMNGQWKKPGVHNMEDFDPDPFMDALNKWGLPWQVDEHPALVD